MFSCGWPFGYEEQCDWLIVRAISCQDFQPMWPWSTNVTDKRTDRRTDVRHAISIPRFIVHRAVKMIILWSSKKLSYKQRCIRT